jgi:hypothetical protein
MTPSGQRPVEGDSGERLNPCKPPQIASAPQTQPAYGFAGFEPVGAKGETSPSFINE